jgi:hypothetical protein
MFSECHRMFTECHRMFPECHRMFPGRASWRRSVEAAVNKVQLAWQANNVEP